MPMLNMRFTQRQAAVADNNKLWREEVEQTKTAFEPEPAMDGVFHSYIKKDEYNQKLGLSLGRSKRGVIVQRVAGLFELRTNLVPGLKVTKINGISVDSSSQAAMLIKSTPVGGYLSVSTEGYCLEATKKQRKELVGLTFEEIVVKTGNKSGEVESRLRVTEVDPNGLFPTVKVGQHLLAVNKYRVCSVKEVSQLLSSKKKLVLIMTEPEPEATEQELPSESDSAYVYDSYKRSSRCPDFYYSHTRTRNNRYMSAPKLDKYCLDKYSDYTPTLSVSDDSLSIASVSDEISLMETIDDQMPDFDEDDELEFSVQGTF